MSQQVKYYYLIRIQYLGFRYHGWQRQPGVKTVQLMIEKTLKFLLPEIKFRILGTSRTDSMVSASNAAFELFCGEELDCDELFESLNYNLPSDIRALSVETVDKTFNIINNAERKEYHYLFAYGEKAHPFAAPLLTTYHEQLDINKMIEGAKLHEGTHNFKQYCYKPSPETVFERTIHTCEIITNTLYQANFFPKNTYMLRVIGGGFMRHQIRLIMGTLIRLGKGEINCEDIEQSLKGERTEALGFVAPASGLILHDIHFRR